MSDIQDKVILIVDDNFDLVKLVSLVFGQTGAQVFTAPDGQGGIRQFHAHQPDLVLLDQKLPDMDGDQVCRQIRQTSDVPIIMLSALGRERDVVRGLECGADDYITKPYKMNLLLARAGAVLRRKKLPQKP